MPMTNPSLSQATALSTLKHSVDTEQPPDIDLIKMHLNGLIEFWKRFDDIQSELEALDENQEPRRYEIQNEYYAIVVRANKIIEKAQPTLPQRRGTVESLATSVTAPMAIKLPEMRLPSFDGNIEDWVSYFDTFKSTIDSNENLTPLQKLQYLRSTLHGKALKCISALNTTDANYYDAIELLKKKYDCPRRIILKHCDAIRDYPRLVKDTPEALDDLVNSVNQHLRALKNLGEDFTRCNGSLISMILSKVSSDTAWLWELTIKGKNMPSYTDLLDFLEKRASCAQTGPSSASAVPLRPRPNFTSYPQSTRPSANFTSHPQSTRPPARSHAFVTSKTRQTADNKSKNASNFNETRPNSQPKECPICYGDHSTWGCEKFRGMTPEKRKFAVERAKLCTNCLHPGHSAQNCDRVTAQIQIFNKNKRPIDCRALIDTCASINLISERLAQKINIPRMKCSVPIGSLNAMTTVATHALKATIASRVSNYQRSLTFLIVNDIAPFVPDQEIDRGTIKIPPNLHLADPEFHRPAPIDLLLGSGTALSILCVGQIVLSRPDESDLYLQKSQLGWVIGGSAPVTSPAHGTLCHATTALQFDLTRFWEVEEGPQRQHLSESDIICESHFQEHTVRNRDGRYVVALPFNEKLSRLGDSKVQAKKRLHSLERKLQREPALKQEYHAVIQEYLDLGHMSELPQEQQSPEGYYLPHHGVVKVTSDTTKLRVVFDGSATTNSGIALNDALHTGPKIQDDLLHILLRFRIHRYVLTGDIEKMYRQFLVRPEDRKFQRILWRDTTGSIKTYELNTVTFGLSAAPYLAIRCLTQLSRDEGHRFPQAGKILLRDFYVDDVLTGTSTIEEALSLREDLTQILKTARLTIRQWASNDLTLLTGLPEQAINKRLYLGESSTFKTLGIVWNSSNDSITYAVETCSPPSRSTKRSITSEIAKIYDPLGLLGPVIITAKMLLQRIWTIKVDWDESLPMDIHTEWIRFYNKLPALNNITFPRRTIIESPRKVELHGFSDASEKAYGACLYLRTTDSRGHTETTLLFAKSKVAPLKTISIPRLELCGALLLTSLVETAKQALPVEIHKTIYWTDSTIVLHWVKTSPHTLKTFVANRVSEIQRRTANADWRHVPTADNPADLISRGQSPEDFLQPSIWQHGPTWLNEEESFWPTTELPQPETIPEQRVAICLKALICDTTILDNCSSWGKLQRIIARCLRWKGSNTTKGSLTSSELRYAHDVIIKLIQRQHFAEELRCLSRSEIGVKGKLQQLNPFIDKDGILRVGGRLKNSRIPFAQKHPIVLPKARITALIIEHEHRIQLHAGTQATLYAIRRRYWPIDGRSQVGKTIRNCVRCYRVQPPPTQYVMGDLPEARVTDSRPFANVGVDYCGPFFIKERRYRSRTHIKVYVAVFVCLSVKAIHLELVSDLTSEAFIAALRRFIARRGHCINIYSDNGTNFVGANNELRDLRELLQSDDHNEKVKTFLADRSITWNFIPPLTPHFGGIWEAAVKSFKRHFWRIAGAERFTFEVFNTLIIEIEAVLNSRPLTPISSDPNDTLVLTPGHFLIGDSLTSLRERDFRDVPSNRLSTWQHIQKLKQHFWNRWYKEYLNEMTSRSRWSSGTHPIKEGTIVLLREDNVPPMQWPLGRVIKVYPGSDGIVRAATVRTATTTLDRGVKRLVPLPNQPEEEPRDPTSTSRTRDPSTDNN
ncbi:uncharacterized protein LOC143363961 [Halictus rubicundus]|uniref:uncharacterized protein LOC143363961 n=1 Tax=Halictus rubicundus TaxID=77578 RepID=UPI0040374B47